MPNDGEWTRKQDLRFELLDAEPDEFGDFDLRVQSCFLYEYARSSPQCREDVERLRSAGIICPGTIPGMVGDSREKLVSLAEYARTAELPIPDLQRIKLLTFVGRFEGFPHETWDGHSEQKEDSLIDLGSESLPWIERPGTSTLERSTAPSSLMERNSRIEEELGLWIDWRLPTERIEDVLKEQIYDLRPPEFPEPDGHKSNYCKYAGTNFPFRFLTALQWLQVRRRASSLEHESGSSDFWLRYQSSFGGIEPDQRHSRKFRQHDANAGKVISWFSEGGRLVDPSGKGRVEHVKAEGNFA